MSDFTDDFGMKLPEGKTCSDCRHFDYCTYLTRCQPQNTVCDWAPNRFITRTTKLVNAVIEGDAKP